MPWLKSLKALSNNTPPRESLLITGANTTEMMAMSLIKMFRDGPEVSFNGSPTVSPTTAAWWTRLCLPWPGIPPPSTYFLALSQAPPVLELAMAIWTPDTRAPGNIPARASLPNKIPHRMGEPMTKMP
eukprot:PhF_6_TR39739/c0_g1_i1/m.59160